MILHIAAEIFKCFSKKRNFFWGYKENKLSHFSEKKDWRNIARGEGKNKVEHNQQETKTAGEKREYRIFLVLQAYETIRNDSVCRFEGRLYSIISSIRAIYCDMQLCGSSHITLKVL